MSIKCDIVLGCFTDFLSKGNIRSYLSRRLHVIVKKRYLLFSTGERSHGEYLLQYENEFRGNILPLHYKVQAPSGSFVKLNGTYYIMLKQPDVYL